MPDLFAVPRGQRPGRFASPPQLVEMTEGATRLLVPPPRTTKGPGKREGEVFYNPAMRFARDVSVLVAEALWQERVEAWGEKARPVRVFDGLAAAGARGVRIAHEVAGDVFVTLNDRSAESAEAIRRNLERNRVPDSRAVVVQDDYHRAIAAQGFDFIDIDPFGTPAPYLEAACLALSDKGILGVSATDTTALAGVFPLVAKRRYFGATLRCVFGHEVGVRVLLGAIATTAARLDKGLEPALVHATDYYYRVYARLRRGANKADAALEKLGYAYLLPSGERGAFPQAEFRTRARTLPEDAALAGPLWTGSLFDAGLLDRLAQARAEKELASPRETDKALATWKAEAAAPILFYDIDEVCRDLHGSPPTMDRALRALRERGFVATRTHFAGKGFKTDAAWGQVVDVIRPLSA